MTGKRKGTVLLVTDRVLLPRARGNDARIIDLIRSLRAEGYRVVLVARRIRSARRNPLPSMLLSYRRARLVDHMISVDGAGFRGGSPSAYDCTPFRDAVGRAVAAYNPVAVIVAYCWMTPCLDVVTNGALKVVDALDLMHVRGQMYSEASEGAWVHCTRDEEATLLARADVVMAIQRHEQSELVAMVPNASVIHVPHACWVQQRSSRAWPRPGVVSFVGSSNYSNTAGIRAFLQDVWPKIREAHPQAELRIYGEVVKNLDAGSTDNQVRLIGYTPRLEEAYAQASVIINPVSLGTGLKIKSVEALAFGKALVTTTCGAAGLEDQAGAAFLMEDEAPAFAAAVTHLLADEARRGSLEHHARALANQRFGPRAAIGELREVIEARAKARPLRVLAQPAFRRRELNPYNWQLSTSLQAAGVQVCEFTRSEALRGGHDIWHLHWPDTEALFTRGDLPMVIKRSIRLLLLLQLARTRGTRVVWTVHNLRSHEQRFPRIERWFWRWFVREVDGVICLSRHSVGMVIERFPLLARVPFFVVPHGHYRELYPNTSTRADARAPLGIDPTARVMTFIGQIREYKNLPELITAFRELQDPSLRLLVAGRTTSSRLDELLRGAAAGDPRIRLDLRLIPEDEMQLFLNAADLVVLPYRDVLNSGAALLALSFNRPVLAPDAGALPELQEQVGPAWLKLYRGTLTADSLHTALQWASGTPRPPAAPLEFAGWSEVARATIAAYRSVLAGRDPRHKQPSSLVERPTQRANASRWAMTRSRVEDRR